jgi:malate synthase
MLTRPRVSEMHSALAEAKAVKTSDVLTAEAVDFLNLLGREFAGERKELLARRQARAQRLRDGELPDFLAQTRSVRDGDWSVMAAPADLADRRVEITGPTDRKMVINALNSGAKGVHGGLRGLQLADLGEHGRRSAQPERGDRAHDPPGHAARRSTS